MLTFLRKIRRSLIESLPSRQPEGSFRKPASPISRPARPLGGYLLYAIGEIALVVIGILIALQINNWNERQKLIDYENKMLNEVLEDLERDTAYLNRQLNRLQKMTKSVDILLKADSYHDSLEVYLDIPSGVYFIINQKAIETIRNYGQQIPLDDELRKTLDSYYQRAQFLVDLIKIEGDTYFYPYIMPYWNKHFLDAPDDSSPLGYSLITDSLDEVITSAKFKDIVISKKIRTEDWKRSYSEIYDDAIMCTDAIKLYLTKN